MSSRARALPAPCHSAVLKARYGLAPDRILLLSLIGLLWDRAEPGGYMRALRMGCPSTVACRVLGPLTGICPDDGRCVCVCGGAL